MDGKQGARAAFFLAALSLLGWLAYDGGERDFFGGALVVCLVVGTVLMYGAKDHENADR